MAVGDALGTTLEFKRPGTFEPIRDMVGGGPFNLKPGQWTDDTSMALCLAESLIEREGFDPVDQLERYVNWYRNGHLSSTGKCFDIGGTVKSALLKFEKTREPYCGSRDPNAAGKAVLKQMKMINPMPYLVSDTEGNSAPYWYFRHGMLDRDTSFAVEAALYYAVLNAHDVSNVNFELAWLKGHGGDYDVPEAYEWVAESVDNANTFAAVDALIGDTVSVGFSGLPTGAGITYTSSNESVFKVVGGQAVVSPDKKDAKVTLTVRVVSDKVAGNGYNYSKVDVTRAFTFIVPGKGK